MVPAPDVILATGDLTASRGTREEYAALRAALDRLETPVFLIPGNHDNRDALRDAFPDHQYMPQEGYIHYVIDQWPVRLVGLDTQIPGKPAGTMDDERLAWLDDCLKERPEAPTVVFMHHPPFRSGISVMDGMRCKNGDALESVIDRHPQVQRLLCGHVHRPICRQWGGTLAMIAPSSLVQLSLDLGRGRNPQYIHEPPAMLLHAWQKETMTSHVVTIGDFEKSLP